MCLVRKQIQFFDRCTFNKNDMAGATVKDVAAPLFDDCLFSDNSRFGLVVTNSSPFIQNSTINENASLGVCAAQGSFPRFENCSFEHNHSFAAQVQDENTSVTFIKCKFAHHDETGSIIVTDKAQCVIQNCQISDDLDTHIEVRNEGHCGIQDSELSNSSNGYGIYLSKELALLNLKG